MSTNLQPTVNDVLQIISDLRGESSINSDASRIRAVSRANQDFSRRMFWRFYRIDNQSQVGTGANSYTIGSATYPMRMKGLTELFVAKTSDTNKTQESMRYKIVDFNTFKTLYNTSNSEQMVYEWFDSANDLWKAYINPAPAATDTITYTFYWEAPAKTATSDEVICPNLKIIANLALAEIYEGEDERDLSKEYKNEAEQMIAEFIGKENSPAVNQTFAVQSNVTKGIGNY
jgi:hypothetical protein